MKILAWVVGKNDLEDKNKDPSKNDVIIDMGGTVTPETKKSSKLIQEETTNKKKQGTIFEKFLKGFYILTVVTCIVCGVNQCLI